MRGGEMCEMCDLAAAILLRCGVSSQDENNGPDNIDLGSPSDLLAADTLHSVESETWEEEEDWLYLVLGLKNILTHRFVEIKSEQTGG